MSPGTIKVLIIGVYLSLLLCLGLFSSRLSRGTSKDYLLASHSIGPFLLLMSLFGTTMTGFALVGSTGEAFTEGVGVYGMLASSSGIIHSLCFFVLGLRLWSWGKKYGYTTQVGFFRDRLNSDKIGLLLFPVLVCLVVPYLLVGVVSAGKAIEGATRKDFAKDVTMFPDHWFPDPWSTVLDEDQPKRPASTSDQVSLGRSIEDSEIDTIDEIAAASVNVRAARVLLIGTINSDGKLKQETLIREVKSHEGSLITLEPGFPTGFQLESVRVEKWQSNWNPAITTDTGAISAWLTELVICCVVLVYVFFGGMRGTAWANTFQTMVFMILGVVAFYLIATSLAERAVADGRVRETNDKGEMVVRTDPPRGLMDTLNIVSRQVSRSKRVRAEVASPAADVQVPKDSVPVEDSGKIVKIFDDKPLVLIQIRNPKTEPEKKALSYSLGDRGWLEGLAIGDSVEFEYHQVNERRILARVSREGLDPWMFATYMLIPFSVGMFPHLFQHWLTAKSANSFKLAVVVHPVFIMIVWIPCILIGVWATTGLLTIPPPIAKEPNKVLGFMVKSLSGDILGGFLLAGILAAIMSSLDSQFLCVGTMFTTDIVVHYGGKERFSDKQIVVISRVFIVLVVATTFALSLTEIAQTRVFQLGIWCFSGFSSLFPLALLAVYWRGLTKWGAYAGVLTAAGVWFYLFRESNFGAIDNWSLNFTIGGKEIHTMPVAGIFLASFAATVLVSLITPKPPASTLEKFFPTKTP